MKKFLILLVLSSNIFLNTYTAAVAADADVLTELKEASGKRKAEDILEKSENSKHSKDDIFEEKEHCPICLDSLDESTTKLNKKGKNCGHIFHTLCIKEWYENKHSCPVCTTKITMLPLLLKDLKKKPAIDMSGKLQLADKGLISLEGHEELLPKNNALYLILTANRIPSIPHNFFTGFNTLQYLSLYQNPLRNLNDGTFKELPTLRTLILAYTQLYEVNPKAFEGLTSVRSLSLYGNNIKSLPDEAFKEMPELAFLNLGHNKLNDINPKTFTDLKLKDISFKKNFKLLSLKSLEEIKKNFPDNCTIQI